MARGLVPNRNVSRGAVRRYPTRGQNSKQIFLYDVVQLRTASGGVVVDQFIPGNAAATSQNNPAGVAVGLYTSTGRPFTFNQPSTGAYVPVSTAAFVDVLMDDNMTYTVECAGTISQGMFGYYAQVTVISANTALGRSGFQVAKGSALDTIMTHASHASYLDSRAHVFVLGLGGTNKFDSDVPNATGDYNLETELEVKLWSTPFGYRSTATKTG